MSFILGIDTGGTYTDGVIVNTQTRKIVCKAKSLTTKEDLTIGIRNCIEQLSFSKMDDISLVSLSTTLATNAVVENRGAPTALIYMGMNLEDEVPAAITQKVKGKFDIMGNLSEDLDEKAVKAVLNKMKGKVKALAISGYASVRNPKHEQQISFWAKEILKVPVVCGHQLTSALGFQHRTVTALLNGKLIPVIEELLQSVREVLNVKSIDAPVMVVKGDGTLMTEAMALERPIDTILSGPAASVIGGMALTDQKDGLVLDMGGTTTDIANVCQGKVKIKNEGAKVGGWHTRVQAVEVSTFGLGGDSRICLDQGGKIKIGPEKVMPLCLAGKKYPHLVSEYKSFRRVGELKTYSEQEADCYRYIGNNDNRERTVGEQKIIEKLKEAPHSLTYLARAIGEDPETIDMTPLVNEGVLERISVTPTDILHAQGTYLQWDRTLSVAGIEILAKRIEVPIQKFIAMSRAAIDKKIAVSCVQSAADFDNQDFALGESREAMYLMEKAFSQKPEMVLQPTFALSNPLVAIGAPAEAWAGAVETLLHTQVLIPEDADVANAFGAAVGQVMETIEILISRDKDQYILNLPGQRAVYNSRQEADFYAVHEGRKYVEHQLRDAGCTSCQLTETRKDILIEVGENAEKEYQGTRLVITGAGTMF